MVELYIIVSILLSVMLFSMLCLLIVVDNDYRI